MKYLALDLELGGPALEYSLLTASFGVFSDDQFVDILNLAIQYDVYHIHPEAMQVNGINLLQHHQSGVSQSEAGAQLIKFLKKHGAGNNLIPVGHGIHSDIAHINQSILSKKHWDNHVSWNVVDTGIEARFLQAAGLLPPDISLSLSNLCAHLEIGVEGDYAYHTAEFDMWMTFNLHRKLVSLVKK